MLGHSSSSRFTSVHTLIIAGIFVIVPMLVVVSSVVGERHSATVRSLAGAQAYVREIDEWHARRTANLKREHGWLSLSALTWLNEGRNPIDSLGTATLKDGRVTVEINPSVPGVLRGGQFTSGIVKTDMDSAGADKIVCGSRAFIVIQRGDRYALRVWDANAPARTRFAGVERYPVSDRWKVAARWEPYAVPKHVAIETVIPGITDDGVVRGVAVFTIDGKEQRLEPIDEGENADYFFIVSDATNGSETYGGGRFLYTAPPKDGMIVLDFNKMTNPPCAFTEFATCPRPLPGNSLSIRIDAGEKNYGGH